MNLPNQLTLSRIFMIVVFVTLASIADKYNINGEVWIRWSAYILAILAGLTDLLDGYLARKWNQITDFGALMDPLADKIFVTAAMLVAVENCLMPAWIAIAVLAREFMVTGLRGLAARKGVVIAADRWGKLKTASQMVMLAIAGFSWVNEFPLREKEVLWIIWMIYMCGVVAVTFGSGLGYFWKYRELIFDKNRV